MIKFGHRIQPVSRTDSISILAISVGVAVGAVLGVIIGLVL